MTTHENILNKGAKQHNNV